MQLTKQFCIGLCGALLLWGNGAWAGVSAVRHPGETYQQARDRSLKTVSTLPSLPTAEEAAVKWDDLDFSLLPEEPNGEALFEKVRDERFLFSTRDASFARRSSWLYPQDGCWIRASVARQLAAAEGYVDMGKVFIFGALKVKTANAPGGTVRWWYHVVPAYRDTSGKPKVVDPAIDPNQPMDLKDWVLTMVPSVDDAALSVCDPATYSPSSVCVGVDLDEDKDASVDQAGYLDLEWDNLDKLGRIPEDELGALPPWK